MRTSLLRGQLSWASFVTEDRLGQSNKNKKKNRLRAVPFFLQVRRERGEKERRVKAGRTKACGEAGEKI